MTLHARIAAALQVIGRDVTLATAAWLLAGTVAGVGGPTETEPDVAVLQSGSFATRILPILTHAGCNAGACHGAATGQGGFKLSLLGYDPEADYARITRELGGRRIDLDRPSESLFLQKPTMKIDHDGGRRLRVDSEAYRTLLEWVGAGVPYGRRDLQVTGIEVVPPESWHATTHRSFALRVTARLSDGQSEDVSALALYTSNDDAVAEVTREGRVTPVGCGLTSIMVRYGGQVAAATVGVPFRGTADPAGEFEARNLVDRHTAALWKRLGLQPAAESSDAEFLRRIRLDLTGRLPTAAEAREFLAAPGETSRREPWIDRLLDSSEFVDFWTLKFADLLLIGSSRGDARIGRAYHQWLRDQIDHHAPWDQTVRALLTAEGDPAVDGPAGFFTLASDPRDLAEQVGSIFLGTQIACARCHAHPTDRWTRDDYLQFAAYFARLTHDGSAVRAATRGEVDDPRNGRPVAPKPLGSPAVVSRPETLDRRIELAEWITAPANPFLARALVNRVWQGLMGRGLVEPVDDLRPTNPPTNPALLAALAEEFVRSHYDLRTLVRLIVTSRTYQLSSRLRPGQSRDDQFNSQARLKPLAAQVFVDAVAQITGVGDHYEDYPDGTRAVQLPDPRVPSAALDVLGRCPRERKCETGSAAGGGLAQALHLINGSTVNGKLGDGIVHQLLDDAAPDRAVIEEFYLRALSRFPDAEEARRWEQFLGAAANRREAMEDLLWALLNSREFAFNH